MLLFSFTLTCFVYSQNNKIITTTLSNNNSIVWKIDHDFHNKYGCSYPVTYELNLEHGLSGLTAMRKYALNDNWTGLPEKTSQDFFNGMEVVRFDYANDKAFISVPFSAGSDSVLIQITNSTGIAVALNYAGICKYYDNRTSAVTVSCDDWSDWVVQDNRFSTLLNIFRSYHLYVTVGVITDANNSSNSTWSILQQQLNDGYIEAASHSRSHPDTPYVDYWSEIEGSYDDIISHLTLPQQFTLGSAKQYVYVWIAPDGSYNSIIDSMLQIRNYLVPRVYSIWNTSIPSSIFSEWDKNVNHYAIINPVVEIGAPSWGGGDTSIISLNSKFDSISALGGIYHFMWHPQVLYPDRSQPYFLSHLNYICNRTNIWYANLGHIYLYHLLQDGSTSGISTAVNEGTSPGRYQLYQNYPNPFNPVTTINYEIDVSGKVILKIFDVLGREIKTLVEENKQPGNYSVSFNGQNLPSGIYFYQLNSNNEIAIKKMVLLK
jgi:hypothetical protein